MIWAIGGNKKFITTHRKDICTPIATDHIQDPTIIAASTCVIVVRYNAPFTGMP